MHVPRSLTATATAVAMTVFGLASAAPAMASAHQPRKAASPAITFFKSPIPVIGTILSDSTSNPYLTIKDGWKMYDPSGICSAYVDLYQWNLGYWQNIWNFSGSPSTTTVTGTYQWNTQINNNYNEDQLEGNATDCTYGNSSTAYDYIYPSLYQESSASYSAGWKVSNSQYFSQGSVEYSTTPGATASFSFSGRLVTLISDQAPTRGKAALYIDGVFKKDVTFTSSTVKNRLVAWNSGYLSATGTHILTVKVLSGRVDIDAFVTES